MSSVAARGDRGNGSYPPKLSGSGMSLVALKAPEASVACVQGAAARCTLGDVSMEASG